MLRRMNMPYSPVLSNLLLLIFTETMNSYSMVSAAGWLFHNLHTSDTFNLTQKRSFHGVTTVQATSLNQPVGVMVKELDIKCYTVINKNGTFLWSDAIPSTVCSWNLVFYKVGDRTSFCNRMQDTCLIVTLGFVLYIIL